MFQVKLQYIGKVQGIEHLGIDPRMWNVFAPGTEWHRSTRMLEGLKELGII